MRNLIKVFSTLVFLAITSVCIGQEYKSWNDEKIFNEAGKIVALNGSRDQAREMLSFALERSPDFHDARILYGRTFAWDRSFDKARDQFELVLQTQPTNKEALSALIDVDIWSGEFSSGLMNVDKALAIDPTSVDFQFQKAKILNGLGRTEEAIQQLESILASHQHIQNREDVKTYLANIRAASLRYQVSLSYQIDFFNKNFDPAHYEAFLIGRNNSWGTSLLRFNFAQRFNTTGFQPEIDLYPKFSKGTYAYINAGFSSTDLFPEVRLGGEVFTKLSEGFEGSAGVRFMRFSETNHVLIYTGTISWYKGNFLFTLRPFITPDDVAGTSYSGNLLIRKYFKTAEDHLSLLIGTGYSPEERRYQSGAGLTVDQIYILKSTRIGLQLSKTLRNNFSILANFDLAKQDVVYDEDEYLIITGIGATVRKRF